MEIAIKANRVELIIVLNESPFLNASNEQQLIDTCSTATFHLNTPAINSLFQCQIDIEELAVFYNSANLFLSMKDNSCSFSSHDGLFKIEFKRSYGSVQLRYFFKCYVPIKSHVSIQFDSDEVQVSHCRRELSRFFDAIKCHIPLLMTTSFQKWWT